MSPAGDYILDCLSDRKATEEPLARVSAIVRELSVAAAGIASSWLLVGVGELVDIGRGGLGMVNALPREGGGSRRSGHFKKRLED